MSETQRSPWKASEYALLDCGAGRKLERLGGVILDRPAPPAVNLARSRDVDWKLAAARIDTDGRVVAGATPSGRWQARHGSLIFNLSVTPFGHVGLFPEQVVNWQWLSAWVTSWQSIPERQPVALNLFAYTGGTTLALAAAGARVVHVDASSPAVKWARRNAADSQLSERPIRWIVDDARKFVAREIRRGNRYDLIALDPPSFGHGPDGKRWSLETDLDALLRDCLQLLADGPTALLLTAHCEHPSEVAMATRIQQQAGDMKISQGRLYLGDLPAQRLDAGYFVRATRE